MHEASLTDSTDWGQRSKAYAKDVRHDISIQKVPLRLRDLFPSKEPSSETQLLNGLKEDLQITNYFMHLNIPSLANFPWKDDAIAFLPFNQPFCSMTTPSATSFRAHHPFLNYFSLK